MIVPQKSVITIGNFDGVHLGHRFLIAETLRSAQTLGAKAILITFSPHPNTFFKNEKNFLLQEESEKFEELRKCGITEIVSLDFNQITSLSPEDFFQLYILPLNPISLVLGANFAFGHQKCGNLETLKALAKPHNIKLVSLSLVENDLGEISSTAIRELIKSGNIEKANRMLGRLYQVRGIIIPGQKIARSLGFPTANISAPDTVLPACGSYASTAYCEGKSYEAITAVTKTPSLTEQTTRIETHLLKTEPKLNIYGKELRIQFHELIRLEERFENLEALKSAMTKDIEAALQFHQNLRGEASPSLQSHTPRTSPSLSSREETMNETRGFCATPSAGLQAPAPQRPA